MDKRAILEKLGFLVEEPQLEEIFAMVARDRLLFQHKKGGVYEELHRAKDAGSLEEVVVYRHIWPHQDGIWVRSAAEFDETDRFRRLG